MNLPGPSKRALRGRLAVAVVALLGAAPAVGGAQSPPTAAPAAQGEVESWLRRADELARLGTPQAARGAYQMLLNRSRVWLDSGRAEDAVALLDHATRVAPEMTEAWVELGRAHSRNRDFLAARSALERAVELGDTDPTTFVFLGAVEWESGDLEGAERAYRRSLELSPGFGRAAAQLGRLMLWRGRYGEAADLLETALAALQPTVEVLFDHAEALRGAGRFEQAVGAYRRVVALAPESLKASYGLAVVLAGAGESDESRAEFGRYESLYREDQERSREIERARGEVDRARSLLDAGEVQAALDHLAELPQSAEVLALMANGHLLAGRRTEALIAMERAVRLDPERADLRRQLGELRMTPSGDGR